LCIFAADMLHAARGAARKRSRLVSPRTVRRAAARPAPLLLREWLMKSGKNEFRKQRL
jgi:hypothetical protein